MSYLGLDPEEMQDMFRGFMSDYRSIKQFIKDYAPKEYYERWKAGGFLLDDDIYSMYPTIEPVFDRALENFEEELDNEEEDDTIEE